MYKSYVPEDRLLEVIEERLSPDFECQGYEGSTPVERIASLVRHMEKDAYNQGVAEVREGLQALLGFDTPKYGWPSIK